MGRQNGGANIYSLLRMQPHFALRGNARQLAWHSLAPSHYQLRTPHYLLFAAHAACGTRLLTARWNTATTAPGRASTCLHMPGRGYDSRRRQLSERCHLLCCTVSGARGHVKDFRRRRAGTPAVTAARATIASLAICEHGWLHLLHTRTTTHTLLPRQQRIPFYLQAVRHAGKPHACWAGWPAWRRCHHSGVPAHASNMGRLYHSSPRLSVDTVERVPAALHGQENKCRRWGVPAPPYLPRYTHSGRALRAGQIGWGGHVTCLWEAGKNKSTLTACTFVPSP